MVARESCHCLGLLAFIFHFTNVCIFLASGAVRGFLLLLRSEATALVCTSLCSFCVEITAWSHFVMELSR